MGQRAAYPGVVPVLQDGTVRLRAHRSEDLPWIVQQCQDPEFARWTTVPQPYCTARAEEFLSKVRQDWERDCPRAARHWAVKTADDTGRARFAGTVAYRPVGDVVAEIGFGLHRWARGRNVMRRAVALALDHAFDVDGVHTMRWQAARGDWASRRVAWANGFTLEGTVRGRPGRPDDPPQAGWVGSLRGAEPGRPVARWLEAPVLAGTGVVLRPWREDDRAALAGAAASDDMGPVLPATDAEGFAGWLLRQREQMASAAGVDWCLPDPRTDRALGWLGVSRLGMPLRHGSGTVGHWLLPYARGRGVLTEALRLAARHAFAPAPEDREDGTAPTGAAPAHRRHRRRERRIPGDPRPRRLAVGRHGAGLLRPRPRRPARGHRPVRAARRPRGPPVARPRAARPAPAHGGAGRAAPVRRG